MNRLIFVSFIVFALSLFASAQQAKLSSAQFTKEEILAFKDVRALLSAIKNGKDYSNYIVRNFSLCIPIDNVDSTHVKLSESGPRGYWTEKQKKMIQNAKKGSVFTLENMLMVEAGKKGLANEPPVSFSIE